MKKLKSLVTLASIVLSSGIMDSSATPLDQNGLVCIAPIPKPTPGKRSLANPTGGSRNYEYSVQIDNGQILSLPYETNMTYPRLNLKRSHLIVIRDKNHIVESFWFRFEEYHTGRLCLWYKPLYDSWSLWDLSDSQHLCECDK